MPPTRTTTVPGPGDGAHAPTGDAAVTEAAGGGSRRQFWALLLPVLALLTAVSRLPSFTRPLWNPDEGYLATQARQLAAGGTLYETVVDRKPPLLPWLYRGAFALFGDRSLWPLRVAAVLAVLAGAVLLASMARRRWGERAGRFAGVCYVLASVALVPEDTQAATFEVFMLPWTILAMWCADRGRWAWAGLAVAGAVLTKQTGGAVLVPVLWLLWSERGGRRPPARLAAWLAAGCALPVLAAALLYGPARFAFWMATGSSSYVSADGSAGYALVRALANCALLAAGCLPMLLAVLYVSRVRRALTHTVDAWLWLAASAVAVTAGFQFFGHYFLQLTPAVALLSAAALQHLTVRAAVAVIACNALIAAGFLAWALLLFPRGELAHQQRLAAEVRARTAPSDRVLLWGMHPEGYWLSARTPASRYLTAGFLTNFSGGRTGARVGERYAMEGAWPYFRRELRDKPPELIVDDSRGKPYALPRTPTLRGYVARHYERVGTVDGAVVYVRSAAPAG
ncbi:glycosyltransferase family 39 protein [Streptomyces sp. WMMB 322]|uniref:ArnT family glycosyltransferase n=1 Tax=Streptomyces sp. WMMB 322 TaxID=1286821 RepID=UPI000823AA61|nr:glycosyltransferase family 39 protein [Streptomyces sp. WMMB 322]SCK49080.1 4-amino-4-deoxy-L-arabinose transferase [Streptomyces sp. WMMB 322]